MICFDKGTKHVGICLFRRELEFGLNAHTLLSDNFLGFPYTLEPLDKIVFDMTQLFSSTVLLIQATVV